MVNIELNIRYRIKMASEKTNTSMMQLADSIGARPSSLSVRMKNGKFTKEELIKFGECMGCRYRSFFTFPDGAVIEMESMQSQIKSALEYAKMSITDLAKKMKSSQPALSKRIKVSKFTQEDLKMIAGLMGCVYTSQFEFDDGTII